MPLQSFALTHYNVTVTNADANSPLEWVNKGSISFLVGFTTDNKLFVLNPLTNSTSFTALKIRNNAGDSATNMSPIQLACDNSACIITGNGAGIGQSKIYTVSSTGLLTFVSYHNWTSTNFATGTEIGKGDGNYYMFSIDSSIIDKTDSAFNLNTLGASTDFTALGITNIRSIVHTSQYGGTQNRLGVNGQAGANSYLIIYNTVSNAKVCTTANLGSANPNGGLAFDTNRNTFFINVGNQVIKEVNLSCSVVNTINLSAPSTINSIRAYAGQHSIYVQQANGKVETISDTTLASTFIFPNTAQSTSINVGSAIDTRDNMYAGVIAGFVQLNFLTGNQTNTGGSTNTGTGGGNAQSGRCGNGTVLDCVGDVSPFAGITGGQNATFIAGSLTNGIGLTHCNLANENDVDTCGSGLFMFLFLLLLAEFLALVGYLGFARKLNAEKDLADIALIMLIIAFTCISIGFYLNWIPDIVFYTIVVLVAGLLTMGLLSRIRG